MITGGLGTIAAVGMSGLFLWSGISEKNEGFEIIPDVDVVSPGDIIEIPLAPEEALDRVSLKVDFTNSYVPVDAAATNNVAASMPMLPMMKPV